MLITFALVFQMNDNVLVWESILK